MYQCKFSSLYLKKTSLASWSWNIVLKKLKKSTLYGLCFYSIFLKCTIIENIIILLREIKVFLYPVIRIEVNANHSNLDYELHVIISKCAMLIIVKIIFHWKLPLKFAIETRKADWVLLVIFNRFQEIY